LERADIHPIQFTGREPPYRSVMGTWRNRRIDERHQSLEAIDQLSPL